MTDENSFSSGFDYRLGAGSLLVLLGLAVPFIPLPGDQVTRIVVRYRTEAGSAPKSFTAETSADICAILAAALAFEDRASGPGPVARGGRALRPWPSRVVSGRG